jgi:hypothetical protein
MESALMLLNSHVGGGGYMGKALLTVMATCVIALSVSTPIVAQESPSSESPQKAMKQKAADQARWEGLVVRSDKDGQTLTVRKRGTSQQKIIHYDSSTQFVSQAHGSKKVNAIDASDVKDNDRVICLGRYDDKGGFHATVISKRLMP